MSFPVNIPFYAFKLRLLSGTQVIKPMADPQALRVGDTLSGIAEKYAEEFQEKVLNKGTYKDLLDEYREGDFLKRPPKHQIFGGQRPPELSGF
jgi:hypothetical protein